METITNIDQNISGTRVKFRVGLIIAGTATAIICAMALLYEVRSADKEASNLIPTSNTATTNVIGKMMSKMVVSEILPFRP
ncbi:MAG TPA: hypothetical protein PLJ60_01905 [Chryseolinea sp.]|nr:hypothetical protein [Chryseolinea sp.]HPM29063.1 hypothetical protein [Chryseolinea sp.]